ncbi:MAG: ABC transporter ATP-binding protein [Firmicutes bacterium]|nr:ABC transporter ATP-binding protein [Bacillota bacterium]
MAIVRFENISKHFGNVVAVDSVTYETEDGEFLTLLGPSGCGKTTTLRMVAGFYYPTHGRLFFDDKDVTYVVPEARNTGMVFQNYALFPHMTVFENIAYGLQARRMQKAVIQKKVADAMELVQMTGYERRKVHELSGGQQQRVALARAVVIQPDILLLDEPLSNLDAKLRKTTSEELRRLQKQLGITTIYVTHDQEEAFSVSDRVIVMNAGAVHQIDTPVNTFNSPKDVFVAEFLGHSNLFPGKIVETDGESIIVETEALAGRVRAAKTRQRPEWKWHVGETVHVMIHTNQLKISSEPKPENTTTGILRFKMFNGLNWNLEFQVGDGTCRAIVPNEFTSDYADLSIGDELTLCYPYEEVYLIKGKESSRDAS